MQRVSESELSESMTKFCELFSAGVTRLMKSTGVELSMSNLYPKQTISIDESHSIQLIGFSLFFLQILLNLLLTF